MALSALLRSIRRPALVAATLLATALPAGAQGYRLVSGDRMELEHSGTESPVTVTVDVDGQVRITDIGGVTVSGETLDEAESTIATAMEDAGIYIDPQVSLSILDYAPVMVAGDVVGPGRFDFVPGMTVASALALSGGSRAGGLTRNEIARLRAELEGGLRTTNLEIASTAITLARHRAFLAGDETELVLDGELRARIPAPDALDLQPMIAREKALLAEDRARADELAVFWENEVQTLQEQVELYDSRIDVQQEIVESAAQALADAQQLQDRGLQTSARMAAVEQRDADARSRVLELESLRMAATRAISSAQRERAQFNSNAREEALQALQDLGVELDRQELTYARQREQLGVLTGGNAGALIASDAVALSFVLQSPREGRGAETELALDTRLMPGDTVIVSVSPLGSGAASAVPPGDTDPAANAQPSDAQPAEDSAG